MLRTCRQLGTRFLVTLAVFGLSVPTLFAAPCSCAHNAIEEQKPLPPCCAERLSDQACEPSVPATDDCCHSDGPCECPGCQCAIGAPDANTPPSIVTVANSDSEFLLLALPASSFALEAEQVFLLSHVQHRLADVPGVPLRALYCVWII